MWRADCLKCECVAYEICWTASSGRWHKVLDHTTKGTCRHYILPRVRLIYMFPCVDVQGDLSRAKNGGADLSYFTLLGEQMKKPNHLPQSQAYTCLTTLPWLSYFYPPNPSPLLGGQISLWPHQNPQRCTSTPIPSKLPPRPANPPEQLLASSNLACPPPLSVTYIGFPGQLLALANVCTQCSQSTIILQMFVRAQRGQKQQHSPSGLLW